MIPIAQHNPARCNKVELQAIEGPIGPELVQHICDLYGAEVDSRYADSDFTRNVFNCNPAGHSYHVFAFAEGRAVGCYAVIPLPITAQGRSGWAGKGEALYLKAEYRAGAHAFFMMQRAHRFASRSVEVHFGITNYNSMVGKIFQVLGFKPLPAILDQRYRAFRPRDVRRIATNPVHLLAAYGLRAAQTAIGWTAPRIVNAPTVRLVENSGERLAAAFRSMVCRQGIRDTRWTISFDEGALRWSNSIGRLDVLFVGESGDEFVAIAGVPRANFEIVHWSVSRGGLPRAIGIVKSVVNKAARSGAATVSFGRSSLNEPELLNAAIALGFVRHRLERIFYVKAPDPYFLDPDNVEFSWRFSI